MTRGLGGLGAGLRRDARLCAGLLILSLMLGLALLGPAVSPYSYDAQSYEQTNLPPGAGHWFGTDPLGRDLFSRAAYGARVSLGIGFAAALINLGLGAAYGGLAGLAGGWIDEVMMRGIDVLYGIPLILVVILLMVWLQPGLPVMLISFGLVLWLRTARIARGEILRLKEEEFVIAARLSGAGTGRILWRHLLPNAAGPLLVAATFVVPEAIFLEAFLSFIGLGVQVPMASWGTLAEAGFRSFRSYPWQIGFPSLLISVTVLGFNLLGEGLQERLDPHRRGLSGRGG